jgi:hypothetical protein
MVMKKVYSMIAFLLLIAVTSFSQIRKIPQAVKENFARQYPSATNVDWDDDLVNVNVNFSLNGEQMNAEYTNKGVWKHTEQQSAYEKLPEEVKDGFKKSKYADRNVKEVDVLYYPHDKTQYRIKAEKSAVEKKYVYFNTEGQLVRESLTI